LAKGKILLVEDDAIESMDITRTLKSFGYDVPYTASRGEEAVEIAKKEMPDLILMDIVLKGEIDGIEAAEQIKKLDIPLIFLTAHSEDATVQKAKHITPYGYLIKPYDPFELKHAIELAFYKNKMEKKLKESEKRYKFIVEAANEGIWGTDVNFNINYVNPKMAEILGYEIEEMIGKPVSYFMFAEDIADHKKRVEKCLKGYPETYERRLKHKNGSVISTIIAATALMDDDGEFVGSFSLFTDITERKEMEKNLLEKQNQLNAIIDGSPVLQFVIDENHRVLYWNQAIADYSGISGAEIIGTSDHWRAFYPDKRPCLADLILDRNLKRLDELYHGKYHPSEHVAGAYDIEDFFPTMGEQGKWLHFTAAPIKNSEGEIIGALETLEDITDRKTVEEALRNETDFNKTLIQSSPIFFVAISSEGKLLMINDHMLQALGYHRNQVVNSDYLSVFVPKEDQDDLKKVFERLIVMREPSLSENHVLTSDGRKLLVEWHGRPVFKGKDFDFFIGVGVDITERKKAEEALKKSETRYRTIFENTGTATAISEDNMILSLVNEEFANLTGYSKDEIENKMTWTNFFVEEEIPRMEEYHRLRRDNPSRVPRTYETVLKDRSGNRKDVFMTVALLPDTKKTLVSVLDITEKKQSRIKLKRELNINQALARIYVPLISPLTTIQDISISILKEAISISGSKHGFVATIDPKTRALVNQTLTKMMPRCEVYEDGKIPSEIIFPIDPDGTYSGLWGHCLNKKESFYTNEAQQHPQAKGVPEGHLKIEKFMAVPVLIESELVGEIALANPTTKDYSDDDVQAVKRIADFFALAIQRKGYEEQIKKSLNEKDLLLKEIHHRVKNNMQIISSILNLQSLAVKDEKLLNILKQNQNRIKSMAIIHEKLYQSQNLVEIDFSEYLESLTADIFYTYSIETGKFGGIDVDLDLEKNIMLNIETAIPCGLIYGELLSNSIRHAFSPDQDRKIKVEFMRDNGNFQLKVMDNGVGFSEGFDFRKTKSLGLQLVNSLVKQIDGTIELDQSQGLAFTVKFHELKYKDRI